VTIIEPQITVCNSRAAVPPNFSGKIFKVRGEGSFPAAGDCQGPGGRACRRARFQLDPHRRKRDEDPRLRASLVADGVAHEAELLDRAKWVEKIASWVEIIEVIGRMISVDVALAHRRIGVVTENPSSRACNLQYVPEQAARATVDE